jgi:hypothetical protein
MQGRRRRRINDELPEGFVVQYIGVVTAKAVADLPPSDIAKYFREHPMEARELLRESYDKRSTPSSFIAEENEGFRVGWFSSPWGYDCVRQFDNLADAATDYLLFSLGKGRWDPSESEDSK